MKRILEITSLEVRPLGNVGVGAFGFDLNEPASEETAAELEALWHEHAIMTHGEADELPRRLVEHTRRPEFHYFHTWQPGDMILWDNWRAMHCTQGTAPGVKRLIHRTTIEVSIRVAADGTPMPAGEPELTRVRGEQVSGEYRGQGQPARRRRLVQHT